MKEGAAMAMGGRSGETGPMQAATMGMELAGSIAGMLLIGWLVDRWLGTSPRWTTVGGLVGLVGGGLNFFRTALIVSKRQAEETERRRSARASAVRDASSSAGAGAGSASAGRSGGPVGGVGGVRGTGRGGGYDPREQRWEPPAEAGDGEDLKLPPDHDEW